MATKVGSVLLVTAVDRSRHLDLVQPNDLSDDLHKNPLRSAGGVTRLINAAPAAAIYQQYGLNVTHKTRTAL